MNKMKRHLLTLYTRTPLHVGSGTSVDVVDLPIMRERITGFPIIPASSLKGVLRQAARELAGSEPGKSLGFTPAVVESLFGAKDELLKDAEGKDILHAGCVQIIEAKLLAFPVRSLAGCFAWVTCPAALRRFSRDTGKVITIPDKLQPEFAVAGPDLLVYEGKQIVLEEYAFNIQPGLALTAAAETARQLESLSTDPLWQQELSKRLAIVHDENFQHFVTTCTEVVARIAINPGTRTVNGGALYNQENVPCEALFYSVINVLPSRRPEGQGDMNLQLGHLLSAAGVIQVGGDETTGHGFCETSYQVLANGKGLV